MRRLNVGRDEAGYRAASPGEKIASSKEERRRQEDVKT